MLRGRYLFHAGACDSCHTDHPNRGPFLAGGRRMDTEFGTFYVPNITPDRETGIGAWSAEDFRRAMIEGRTPAGSHYYPVFPYRWYTGMSDQDVADMWAYLQSVPPVRNRVREHDLPFPFNLRFLLLGWKLINFDPARPCTTRSGPRPGTAAPIWSTISAIAAPATRRRCCSARCSAATSSWRARR